MRGELDKKPQEAADIVDEIPSVRKDRQDPAIQAKVNEWFASIMEGCGSYKDEIREQLWGMVCDWSAWTLRHQEPKCLVGSDLVKTLREQDVQVPILVIIGEKDWEGSIRSSEKLLKLVPSARRVDISGAGHFSNMERPEVFTKDIELFFEEQK